MTNMDVMKPAVSVQNLTVAYSGAAAVRDVSLEVASGEILALLGPNGAGKTTLLLTIAGFLSPTAGEVHIAGQNMARLPVHRRVSECGLGMILDDRCIIGSLTVSETLSLVRPWELNPYELFPELEALAGRRCGLLSGGEQQILAVARGLVSRPRVLLIDELSLGLAPLVVRRILEVLVRTAGEWDMAVLLVEQHVEQALSCAHRAAVLVNGLIQYDGPATDLSANRDLLVASYLGARGHGDVPVLSDVGALE